MALSVTFCAEECVFKFVFFFQFNNMMQKNSNDNSLLFLTFCICVYVHVLPMVLHLGFWQGYSFLEVLRKTACSKQFFMTSSEQLL